MCSCWVIPPLHRGGQFSEIPFPVPHIQAPPLSSDGHFVKLLHVHLITYVIPDLVYPHHAQ